MRKKYISFCFAMLCCFLLVNTSFAQQTVNQSGLKHWMTAEELLRKGEIGKNFVETNPPTGTIRNIAEFDKMEGALVRYPFGIPIALIKEMANDVFVTTIVANQSEQNSVINQYTSAGVNLAHCKFIRAASDSYWTRDYGPWFVAYGNNQIGIIDFPYNRPRPNDDEIPKKVADSLNLEWFGMNISHTGGNYMTDGMGLSASTTLVWEENPGQTHAQINQKMLNYLGINDYHVVADPNNTYIDHIDCWAKFLAPDKILVRSVPTNHPQYNAIEAAATYWQNQTSTYGTPFQVFRVYTPDNQPYTNSLILNNKVFVPITGSQWDDEAIASYQEAMPGYIVLGITENPSTPWESTDALHCRVMGLADRHMVYIGHHPRTGTLLYQDHYHVQINVTPYSGAALNPDSVLLFYKLPNICSFQTVTMTHISGNTYDGKIPMPVNGGTIAYYFYVADQQGNYSYLPFTGISDPFVFQVNPQTNNILKYPTKAED
jgi:agmatine/peptidylarginine deiminase